MLKLIATSMMALGATGVAADSDKFSRNYLMFLARKFRSIAENEASSQQNAKRPSYYESRLLQANGTNATTTKKPTTTTKPPTTTTTLAPTTTTTLAPTTTTTTTTKSGYNKKKPEGKGFVLEVVITLSATISVDLNGSTPAAFAAGLETAMNADEEGKKVVLATLQAAAGSTLTYKATATTSRQLTEAERELAAQDVTLSTEMYVTQFFAKASEVAAAEAVVTATVAAVKADATQMAAIVGSVFSKTGVSVPATAVTVATPTFKYTGPSGALDKAALTAAVASEPTTTTTTTTTVAVTATTAAADDDSAAMGTSVMFTIAMAVFSRALF